MTVTWESSQDVSWDGPPDPLQLPPHAQVLLLGTGKWLPPCLRVVSALGIADLLVDGPQSVQQLAEAAGCDPRSLARVLRALAAFGVFAVTADGRWRSTPCSDVLRKDVPGSLHEAVMLTASDFMWSPYAQLLDAVRNGSSAFEDTYGDSFFEHLRHRPADAQLFDQGMTGYSGWSTPAVVEEVDFSRFGVVADLGGGRGTVITEVLRQNPAVKGILFDQPHVIARAEDELRNSPVADRLRLAGGDFFTAVPGGADAYLLHECLHDWDDDDSTRILKAVRAAMSGRREARLLVVEHVVTTGNGWDLGKLLDIEMLVTLGGQERTEDEWRELLAGAGFRLLRTIPTATPLSVLEAVLA